MDINFRRAARGPGWERWVIVEDQHGDAGFAGEILMTFSDESSYADLDCHVLFGRDLNEDETNQLLDSLTILLTGEGNVSVFSARQIACRNFSLMDEDLDEDFEDEETE